MAKQHGKTISLFISIIIAAMCILEPYSTAKAMPDGRELVSEACTDTVTVWENPDGTRTAEIEVSEAGPSSEENSGEPERLEESAAGGFGLENTGDATKTLVNNELAKNEPMVEIDKDNKSIKMYPVIPDELPADKEIAPGAPPPQGPSAAATQQPSAEPSAVPTQEPAAAPAAPPAQQTTPAPETPLPAPSSEAAGSGNPMEDNAEASGTPEAPLTIESIIPQAAPDIAPAPAPPDGAAVPSPETTDETVPQPSGQTEPAQTATPQPSQDPVPTPVPSASVLPEPSTSVPPEPSASLQPEPSASVSPEPVPELTTEKIGFDGSTCAGVKYENVFAEGMHIEVRPVVNGVKENVVIDNYFGVNSFQYLLKISDMTPVQNGKEIILNGKNGIKAASIPAPFMTDAAGCVSYDIKVLLEPTNVFGEYYLTYTMSDAWLADAGRAYPVIMDPTVNYDSSSNSNPSFEDNIVVWKEPDTVFPPESVGYTVGTTGVHDNRLFVRTAMPSDMIGCTVLKFDWYINVTDRAGSGNFRIVPLTQDWHENTVTWNTPPNSNLAWNANYIVNRSDFSVGWNVIDITNVAAAWYNPWNQQPNYGFMMNSDPENYTVLNRVDIASANATSNKMKFVVKYAKPSAAETPAISAAGYGANSGTGYVNLSWPALPDVSGYYIGIFNGSDYQTVNVGNVTSWSTAGRGIWPTASEIAAGRYLLHIDDSTHQITAGGAELPCVPAFTYRNYNGGSPYANSIVYYFRVIPYNQYGYPASYDTAPTVAAVLPDRIEPSAPSSVAVTPVDWSNQTVHKLSWSGIRDYAGVNLLTDNWGIVEYSFDATNVWTNTGVRNGSYANLSINTAGLGDGQHTVLVRGRDDQGNYGASASAVIKIDRTGPLQPALSILPNIWTNQSSVSLSWSGIADNRGLARIEKKIDAQSWVSLGTNQGNYSGVPVDISTLSDGTHIMTVRGVDTVGNNGTEKSITIYKDTAMPQLASLAVTPDTWTNGNDVTVSWTGAGDVHSGISKIEYRIDGGSWMDTHSTDQDGSCVIDIQPLTDGQHTIKLRLTDAAGNFNDLNEIDIYKDVTPPQLQISSPGNGNIVSGLLEVWGDAEDIAMEEWELEARGSLGKTVQISKQNIAGTGFLLGTVNMNQFEDGETVSLHLSAADKAGNPAAIGGTGSETAVTVDKSAKPVVSEVAITGPSKGATVSTPQSDVTYAKTYPDSEKKSIYYIDGVYAGEETGGAPFVFDAVTYAELSKHSVAVLSQDENNAMHYSGGLVARTALSDAFENESFIAQKTDVDISKDGVTISGNEGTIVSTTFNSPNNILALRLNATENKPAGTDIKYYYSVDNGSTWLPVGTDADVYVKRQATSVAVKAELSGTAGAKPVLQGWELTCITEQNPHLLTVKLQRAIEKASIAGGVMTEPSQKIEYTGGEAFTPDTSVLFVDGMAHSQRMQFDTLAFLERTTHTVAMVAQDANGRIIAGNDAQNDILLRETPNTNSEITRELKSGRPLYALHLESSASGDVAFEISLDGGETWLPAETGKNTILPRSAQNILIKARPQNGGKLKAWHVEGVSMGSQNVWVQMVEPPGTIAATSSKGINIVSWGASPTLGAGYNLYRNGMLIAQNIAFTGLMDAEPDKVSVYSLRAQVTFPQPSDYDPDIHKLVRESVSVSSQAVLLEEILQEADPVYETKDAEKTGQTYGTKDEEDQSLYVNALYGGDYTFSQDTTPPDSKIKIEEKLLGSNQYCAMGFEPININTGNFFMQQQDYRYNDVSGANLDILRTYNTLSNNNDGPFGSKWENAYSQHLRFYDGEIAYIRTDGSTVYFTKNADGTYSSNDDDFLTFTKKESRHIHGVARTEYVVRQVNGNKTVFTGAGLLKRLDYGNGNITEITRDQNGLITGITAPSGAKLDVATDAAGHITKIVTPDGSTLAYAYDKNNNMTQYTGAAGETVRYVYDLTGRMTEWYDANGNCQAKNTYDSRGRVVKQIDANNGVSTLAYFPTYTKTTDADGNTKENYFDGQGRTIKIVDGNGGTQLVEYGADGNIVQLTDAMGAVTKYGYDANGNKIKEIAPNGDVVQMQYDKNNNMTSLTDQLGNTTTYRYDKNNNMIRQANPDGSILEYRYNSRGQVVLMIDPLGGKTQYEYDENNLIKQTDAKGSETAYEYDSAGNMTCQTDPSGAKTVFEYDNMNNLVKTTFADGTSMRYGYDAVGNRISVTDPRGGTTKYEYDALSRMTATILPDGSRSTAQYTMAGGVSATVNAKNQSARYEYDGNGNVVKSTDPRGSVTEYEYDANNRVVRQTLPGGGVIEYRYGLGTGLLAESVDPAGNSTKFEYDKNGNLVRKILPNGSEVTAEYDSMNRSVKQTDANGNATVYEYNKAGLVISQTDPTGAKSTFEYDALGNPVKQTDALGASVTNEYDKNGRIISSTDALGGKTVYEYDASGQLVRTTDALGNQETYEYDASANLIKLTDARKNSMRFDYDEMGRLQTTVQPNQGKAENEYDETGLLIKQTDVLGNATAYEYNENGQTIKVTDAMGSTTQMAYDGRGNMVKVISADGSQTLYTYDKAGRLTQTTDKNGLVTGYAYDAMGQVTSQTANGKTTAYEYDKSGNITALTDAENRTVKFEYDPMNRLTKTTYPDNTSETRVYDALGRLVKVSPRNGVSTTYTYDKAGNVVSTESGGRVAAYEYDILGRVKSSTLPNGSKTEYEYDQKGNLTASTDAEGNRIKFEYDALSLLLKTQYANGTGTENEYDLKGNLVKTQDALGASTKYGYDALGRMTEATDPLGNATQYGYDTLGNLAKITDANGNLTAYTYDEAGNMLTETNALGNTVKYEYTKEGWLSRVIKADGKEITYSYDRAGQLNEENYAGETKIKNSYNQIGQVTTMEGPDGKTEYQYDEKGQLISVTNPAGDVVKYSYDNLGRKSGVTYPDGRSVQYEYDSMDNLIKVTGLDGTITRYEYDSLGQRTKTSSGGISTTYAYDEVGNLTGQNTTGKTSLQLSYAYDANSRITAETRTEKGRTVESEYSYDKNGQLKSFAQNGDYSEEYSYDPVGNMLAKTVNGTEIKMTYTKANQLAAMEAEGRTIQYTYDANGDLTSKSLGNLQNTYSYDVRGNLISYSGYDGYQERYAYDGAGMLAAKENKGESTHKTLEELLLLAELPDAQKAQSGDGWERTDYINDATMAYYQVLQETKNGETTSYDYGMERISALSDGIKQQYVYDGRGSVAQTVTQKDGIANPQVQSMRYTPFGEQMTAKVSGPGYNGEVYNAATGMLNLRARQYEPAMMRFSQKDIVKGITGSPITLNRYAYTWNDPVNLVDRDGRQGQMNAKAADIEAWRRANPSTPLSASTKKEYAKQVKTATKYGNTQAKAWATGSSVMQDVVDQGLSIIEAEKAAERAKEEARQQALKEISRYMTNSTASTLSAATQSIIAETQAQVAAALKTGSLTIYDINKLALQACHKVYKDETGRDLLVDNELDRQSVAGAIYRQEAAREEKQRQENIRTGIFVGLVFAGAIAATILTAGAAAPTIGLAAAYSASTIATVTYSAFTIGSLSTAGTTALSTHIQNGRMDDEAVFKSEVEGGLWGAAGSLGGMAIGSILDNVLYNPVKNVGNSAGVNKGAGKLNDMLPDEVSQLGLDDLENSLPDDWTFNANGPNGNDYVHIKDVNGNYRVRIDPPDKVTDYTHMHLYDDAGASLDIDGNIVPYDTPDAHIPYNK